MIYWNSISGGVSVDTLVLEALLRKEDDNQKNETDVKG